MNRRLGGLILVIALIAIAAALAIWAVGRFSPGGDPGASGTGDPAAGIPAAAVDATIEYVHDGDTLFLTDGTKVRLLGVDTPEVGDNLECYGDEATAALRAMLPEGTTVKVLADAQALDQYGRSLLLVWLPAPGQGEATFVNLALIQQGMAEAVVLEPNLLYSDQFESAEDAAQAAGAGIWSACR